MKTLVALCLFFAVTSATVLSFKDVIEEEWQAWKQEHGKTYDDAAEERFRMKVFMENKHKIARHNQKASNGIARHNQTASNGKSYHMAMNQFGDLLHHEFVRLMNGYKNASRQTENRENPIFMMPLNFELPRSVDWRDHGYVTPVKDQGHCGSCWSFSTTGALEGQNFRKTGKLVSLSEQNLIDCSTRFGNNGCNGGLMDNAFKYIKANGGIDTEQFYPYEGKDDKCRFNKMDVGAVDTGFVDVPAGSESHLQAAVASVGPVSVAIDASHESFQFYHHGVYDEEECSSEDLDHGVLVVGYGEDPHGKKYWIVKNSWGTKWGRDGFVYMARNRDNQCGIASAASYPLV